MHRRSDPLTSRLAISVGRKSQLEDIVLAKLDDARGLGMTTYEMSKKTGLNIETISPRFRPLADIGLVRDSGYTRDNPRTGRPMTVWVLSRYRGKPKPAVPKARPRPHHRIDAETRAILSQLARIAVRRRMKSSPRIMAPLIESGVVILPPILKTRSN